MAGAGSPAWNRGRRPVWSAAAALQRGDVRRGKVEKLQGEVGERAVRSVWVTEGWREELHGSGWPAAANGDRSACRLLDVRVVYGEVWTTRSCLLCSSCALWLYIWLASGSGFLTVAVVDQLQWSILFHENLALFLAFLQHT